MSISLVTLSPELILRIVDFVTVRKRWVSHRSDGGDDWEELGGKSETKISDKKPQEAVDSDNNLDTNSEGQRSEIDVADRKSIAALARTCTSFYNICCPLLFRHVELRNNETSSAAIRYLSMCRQQQNVQDLHFIGYVPGDGEDKFNNIEAAYPKDAREVMQNLSCFPNLHSLTVEFDYGFEDHRRWSFDALPDCLSLKADESESEETVREKEGVETWRALMAQAFEDVASNQIGKIKTFVYRNAFMVETSIFWTDKWRQFLGNLEEFRIGLMPYDNGAGWEINKCLAYPAFTSHIGHLFLDHAINLTRLTLGGSESGPLGCEGYNHAPHALESKQVPHLQELELHYFSLDPALVEFLISHDKVLQYVSLIDCFSSAGESSLADNGLYWAEFLNKWAERKPAVKYFEVKPLSTLDPDEQHEEDEKVQQILEADRQSDNPNPRKYLQYAFLDDKYGMLFFDEEMNDERWLDYSDWSAYLRFQDMTRANRERP